MNSSAGTHIDGEYGFCPSTCPADTISSATTTTTTTTTTTIFIYLDAEEEEDPLVVHVVDLLVKSGMERPVSWVGRSKELARPAVSGEKKFKL